MPAISSELPSHERRRQAAAILARGVIRYRDRLHLAPGENLSLSGQSGLEFCAETRLSVSVGTDLESETPD
jgi:hypothetical protein